MNLPKRVAGVLLLTAIVLFLGMLFWPFVLNNILQPIGLVLWFLLRILILSVHQKYFWYALIFAACIVLFRLLPETQPDAPAGRYRENNSTITRIEYWRGLFRDSGQHAHDEKILRDRLTHLLTSLYASKQSTSNDFRIHDALKQGTIPLPGNIHAFLFPDKPQVPGGSLQNYFQSFRTTLRTWIRRRTGQAQAEDHRRIEEVLHFLETSLEIKHDDGTLTQHKH